MRQEIGTVRAIFRYPVKSMAGEEVASAALGWRGLEGDRRLAFMREGDAGGFPFLTAGKLPAMIRYRPVRGEGGTAARVATPRGEELELDGEPLRRELSEAHGREVRLVHLKHGIFDEADVSVISAATVDEIARLCGREPDVRRFRPNIFVEPSSGAPFHEDAWVGRTLVFGEREDAAAIAVTQRDLRCSMINLDPDTGASDPRMLKAVGRVNQTFAGVYCSVVRTGTITAGDRVRLV